MRDDEGIEYEEPEPSVEGLLLLYAGLAVIVLAFLVALSAIH